jgi:hypothetical protein
VELAEAVDGDGVDPHGRYPSSARRSSRSDSASSRERLISAAPGLTCLRYFAGTVAGVEPVDDGVDVVPREGPGHLEVAGIVVGHPG